MGKKNAIKKNKKIKTRLHEDGGKMILNENEGFAAPTLLAGCCVNIIDILVEQKGNTISSYIQSEYI